jgi:hypothetical protein
MRTHKVCNACKENKEVSEFYNRKCQHTKKDGTVSEYLYLKPICKKCWDKESRGWFRENWLAHLVQQARNRAKNKNVPFDITVDDIKIVDTCPYLQIPIRQNLNAKGPSPNSPTIDRIIPELGYTKGNVQLISHKANAMKNNCSLEQLLIFAENVKKLHGN